MSIAAIGQTDWPFVSHAPVQDHVQGRSRMLCERAKCTALSVLVPNSFMAGYPFNNPAVAEWTMKSDPVALPNLPACGHAQAGMSERNLCVLTGTSHG